MKSIGIVGAGQMGNGIAQITAQNGYHVVMTDLNQHALDLAMQTIAKNCDRLIEKEKMNGDDKSSLIKNIKTTTQMHDLSDCDCVIEAVTEELELKLKIIRDLDEICKPDALLCSNTSSISITKIAGATKRPTQVCGMHFMNPVPLMTLVEGIRGLQTSDDTFKKIRIFSEKLGKVFIEANDHPGFVVNRILLPMINEAVFTLSDGIASAEDIDQAMKLGTNQPMGPLALADLIGLDTCLSIMNVLHEGLGESKYRPCPLLVKYVEAGWLGRKTGRGFYVYNK
ncbi:MAG: 3-hydroxybutyryl-CoA dehydrogenase [Gammaproteobacteria bacterium]|jgi:3-hydroxybutyryl-CoA dehydrogenase